MISVIILNYNGKKWLEKCLDSLFNQTYKEFEIIFVDNNSSDDSVEFVNNRYGDRSNLKVIKSDKN
ncbi:MAG TPA: glycosyltransferase, partial [bacterium]|nr:glycosyltransferase [bacterium]